MAGIDDNVAIIRDWIPPSSPSPRAFFSSVLGDSGGSKKTLESAGGNQGGGLFLDSEEQMSAENEEEQNVGTSGFKFSELGAFSEQKSSFRGGLVERMAARAGFNAPRLNTESIRSAEHSMNPDIRSPYLTIPPGLSPTSLLDSPGFLTNSLPQPSTTTGKFSFAQHTYSKSTALVSETNDRSKNFIDAFSASTFAFKPVAELGSSFFLGVANKVTPSALPQSFPSIAVSVQSENTPKSHDRNTFQFPLDLCRSTIEKDSGGGDTIGTEKMAFDSVGESAENSPPLDERQDEELDQRVIVESMVTGGNTLSEDGYNWRKYGHKQVKGSEYPRSYYKCMHPTCSVKKKVERSHEGHITEIIYKGAHNHPKPPPNRHSVIGNLLMDMQLDVPEQNAPQCGTDNNPAGGNVQKGTADWRQDNVEVTSSASVTPEIGNPGSAHVQNGNHFESPEAVDVSSTFSNDEDEDDQATHGSVGYDGEGDESESKRRKIEPYAVAEMSGATRAIREPRVVVQTTSEVDILDDGYRWRKYGQKVVKRNPNPRSYYKCTSAGCGVRKHVERASHDLKSVITTYEGKHNHDVPAARNSSNVNSGNSNTTTAQAAASIQTHVQRPEPSHVNNNMPMYVKSAAFGSFGMPGRQQLGPSSGFFFAMNQPGLSNLAMAGFEPGQHKMPLRQVHPFLAQQRSMSEMGFMLPKGEPKMEPLSKPNLNLSNNASVYQQFKSRLPLGPQM